MSSRGGAKWVRECMEHYGLSRMDLMERTGLDHETVCRIADGRFYQVQPADRCKVAEVFKAEYESRYGRRGTGTA